MAKKNHANKWIESHLSPGTVTIRYYFSISIISIIIIHSVTTSTTIIAIAINIIVI